MKLVKTLFLVICFLKSVPLSAHAEVQFKFSSAESQEARANYRRVFHDKKAVFCECQVEADLSKLEPSGTVVGKFSVVAYTEHGLGEDCLGPFNKFEYTVKLTTCREASDGEVKLYNPTVPMNDLKGMSEYSSGPTGKASNVNITGNSAAKAWDVLSSDFPSVVQQNSDGQFTSIIKLGAMECSYSYTLPVASHPAKRDYRCAFNLKKAANCVQSDGGVSNKVPSNGSH